VWLEKLSCLFKGALVRGKALPEGTLLAAVHSLSRIISPPSSHLAECFSIQDANQLVKQQADDPRNPPSLRGGMEGLFKLYLDLWAKREYADCDI